MSPARLAVPSMFGHAGRLGNQLWVVAATAAVARRHDMTPALPDDWSYRDVYQIPDDWFVKPESLGRYSNVMDHPDTQHLPAMWREYLQDVTLLDDADRLIRRVLALQPDARAAVDEIAAPWFAMPADLESQRGAEISIHVRRTDNVTNEPGTINCLPRGYYDAAIDQASEASGDTCASPRWFTDDPQYVHDVFDDIVFDYHIYRGVPRSKEVADLYRTEPVYDWVDLAILAGDRAGPAWDAVVISNSSYAWWGAWLSGCGHVFYPSYWWGPKLSGGGHDPARMFTGLGWSKIECEEWP